MGRREPLNIRQLSQNRKKTQLTAPDLENWNTNACPVPKTTHGINRIVTCQGPSPETNPFSETGNYTDKQQVLFQTQALFNKQPWITADF
jgi:hypothetical protein